MLLECKTELRKSKIILKSINIYSFDVPIVFDALLIVEKWLLKGLCLGYSLRIYKQEKYFK